MRRELFRKGFLRRCLPVCLALLALGCTKENADPEGYTHVRAGDRLPGFTITEYAPEDAVTFDSRNLGGRKTLIYFFWSECPDCRVTTPHVMELWTQLADREDVALVCIARGGGDAAPEKALAYWGELAPGVAPLAMPALFYDRDRQVYDLFASQNVPRFYLAGADGVVSWESAGNFTAAELLQRIDAK